MTNLRRLSSDSAYAPLPLFITVVAGSLTVFGSTVMVGVDEMLIDVPERLPADLPVRCTIELNNRVNHYIPVTCMATTAGYDGCFLRLAINEFATVDGRDNLRNLVLLHAGDPGQAARDLRSS